MTSPDLFLLELRNGDSNGLRVAMTDTDIHSLDACFLRGDLGITV